MFKIIVERWHLKIPRKFYLEKNFSSYVGFAPRFWPACRSRPGPRPHQPRASRSSRAGPPRLGPAQLRALAFLPRAAQFPCWSPCHATTAVEKLRRVATTCRRRPPRGSRGLTLRPRTRLQLPVPARSLTLARISSSPLQSRALELRPRRARSSAGVELPHHRAISRLLVPAAPPRPPSSRARACAAFRAQVEPPPPASRHRRPWRRRARPPWKPSSFSSPASPSYPTALAFS